VNFCAIVGTLTVYFYF